MIVAIVSSVIGVCVLVVVELHNKVESEAEGVKHHIVHAFDNIEDVVKNEIKKSTSSIHSAIWDASFSTFPDKPVTPPASPEAVN